MKKGHVVPKEQCKYCGKEISKSNISKHIRSHESGNFDKYSNRLHYHLDHNDLFCKFCNKEYKNTNSLCQHEIRCINNPDRLNMVKNNFNGKNYVPWNKGLTKETDNRILKASETYKKNKQLGLHKNISNPMDISEVRKKLSETILEKSKNGEWHTSLAKHIHYNYNDVDLHGTWEVKYAKYLDELGIKWERCKDRFPYEYEGKTHYYTPDFHLLETNTYVEIKGYASKKDYAKWIQFPKDIPFQVLMKKDLILLGIDV